MARSACGHKQGSAGATHWLRDSDEADAADRERTAAVPAKWGARQRRERGLGNCRARWILRRLGFSEETWRAIKGARSGRSCEGVAGQRDVHGVRTQGALGPPARAGDGGGHSRSAGWRQGGRSRPGEVGGHAGVIGCSSEAR